MTNSPESLPSEPTPQMIEDFVGAIKIANGKQSLDPEVSVEIYDDEDSGATCYTVNIDTVVESPEGPLLIESTYSFDAIDGLQKYIDSTKHLTPEEKESLKNAQDSDDAEVFLRSTLYEEDPVEVSVELLAKRIDLPARWGEYVVERVLMDSLKYEDGVDEHAVSASELDIVIERTKASYRI